LRKRDVAKSTAQKKSDKKKRGSFARSRSSVRYPELHEAGGRAVVPPHPVKPPFSPMAPPNKRLAHLVRIELVEPYARDLNLNDPTERATLRAHMSDGRTFDHIAQVVYAEGERERVVEAALGQRITCESDLHAVRKILDRRARALEMARGALQSRYACIER
jgi:hypothetical protein